MWGDQLGQPPFSSRATRSWLSRTMPRCIYWTFQSYSAKRRMKSPEPVRKGMVIRQSRAAEYMDYKKSVSGIHL